MLNFNLYQLVKIVFVKIDFLRINKKRKNQLEHILPTSEKSFDPGFEL